MKSHLGEIRVHKFKNGEHTIRVIGSDEFEVFYDVWNEHSNSWTYTRKRSIIYYRFSKKYFLKSTELTDTKPLTKKEIQIHRPDLPHRLCISEQWKWNLTNFESMKEFKQVSKLDNFNSKIEANKLILFPKGPNGGTKSGVTIVAQNGNSFTEEEVLWKAHNIQSDYVTDAIDGIGIYRSGLSKGIPSYYIGEKYDDAGNNKP